MEELLREIIENRQRKGEDATEFIEQLKELLNKKEPN